MDILSLSQNNHYSYRKNKKVYAQRCVVHLNSDETVYLLKFFIITGNVLVGKINYFPSSCCHFLCNMFYLKSNPNTSGDLTLLYPTTLFKLTHWVTVLCAHPSSSCFVERDFLFCGGPFHVANAAPAGSLIFCRPLPISIDVLGQELWHKKGNKDTKNKCTKFRLIGTCPKIIIIEVWTFRHYWRVFFHHYFKPITNFQRRVTKALKV